MNADDIIAQIKKLDMVDLTINVNTNNRYTRGRRLIKPLPRYKLLTNHRIATQYRRYKIYSMVCGRMRSVDPNISSKPQQRNALDMYNMILDIARKIK